MRQMMLKGAVVALVAAVPFTAQAQRSTGPNSTPVPMQVALKAGSQTYSFSGPGLCHHTPNAGIYEQPALMWTVRHSEANRSVNLALWRLKSGGDMMNLSVTIGGASHRVSTVQVKGQGQVVGSGKATFAKTGDGGTFTIDATAQDGTRITGTLSCSTFLTPVEEGGA